MSKTLKPTQTQAYIEAVREKLGGATDYKIGQVMEIRRQRISEYVAGTQHADAYACTRIAMLLGLDPLEVIAQVEADHAKTEDRREFWKSVNFGLKRTAAVFVLSAMLGFFGYGLQGGGKAQADELRPGPTSHNGALRSRLARIGRKVEAWTKAKFGCCWRWCGYCGT